MASLDELLQGLYEVKTEKARLNSELKEQNAREEYLESLVIISMKCEGLDKVTADKWGTATLKSEKYPGIENWDDLREWIVENDAWELLKKEIKAAVWRESYDAQGVELPGVGFFLKESLLFRKGKGE